jgi:hypothetical protein
MLVLAALFGALSALLAAAYIALYNLGIKLFQQPSLFVLHINVWPLLLITFGGLLIGLMIKSLGRHGGLGVANVNTPRLAASTRATYQASCFKDLQRCGVVLPLAQRACLFFSAEGSEASLLID